MGPKMREAIEVMKSGRIFSSAQLAELGIERRVLRRLRDIDAVEQVQRGYYCVADEHRDKSVQPDHPLELEDMAIGCARGGPESFICFYPAAHWHNLTVDTSFPVITVGIPHSRGLPSGDGVELYKFHRFRQEATLSEGIETAGECKGVEVRITNRERTVVDLYRYSPMNGKQETANILIDEESAVHAINRYLATGGTPAALIRMAAHFGVDASLGNILKNVQSAAQGLDDDDYDEAPTFRP
jgi:predicted transcriptional regulator of viral defense system